MWRNIFVLMFLAAKINGRNIWCDLWTFVFKYEVVVTSVVSSQTVDYTAFLNCTFSKFNIYVIIIFITPPLNTQASQVKDIAEFDF